MLSFHRVQKEEIYSRENRIIVAWKPGHGNMMNMKLVGEIEMFQNWIVVIIAIKQIYKKKKLNWKVKQINFMVFYKLYLTKLLKLNIRVNINKNF